MKGKRPDYTVNTVVQTDNGDRWREIGVALPRGWTRHRQLVGADRPATKGGRNGSLRSQGPVILTQ